MSKTAESTTSQNQPLHKIQQNQLNKITEIQNLNQQTFTDEAFPANPNHIVLNAPATPILIRSNYDYSLRVDTHIPGESMTDQDAKDECDINLILEKFAKTGLLEHVKDREPRYGDFSNVPFYKEAIDQVHKAEAAFMELPAKTRLRFDNDAMKFMEFVNNPKDNIDEMIELGLAVRRPPDQLQAIRDGLEGLTTAIRDPGMIKTSQIEQKPNGEPSAQPKGKKA